MLPFCRVVGAMAQLGLHGMPRYIHFSISHTIIAYQLASLLVSTWLAEEYRHVHMTLVVETDVTLVKSLKLTCCAVLYKR